MTSFFQGQWGSLLNGERGNIVWGDRPDIVGWSSRLPFSEAAFLKKYYHSSSWPSVNRNFLLIWESCLPPKIRFFSWLLFHNRLPTKEFLLIGCSQFARDPNCPFCSMVESWDHAIVHYFAANNAWRNLFQLFGVQLAIPYSAYDFLLIRRSFFQPEVRRDLWFIIAWSLWKHSNIFVFKERLCYLVVSSIYLCFFIFRCNRRMMNFVMSDIYNNPNLLLGYN